MVARTIAGVVAIHPQLLHEGSVDLQAIEWKLLQIGEAGITGAEIVEGDAHAERLNPAEGASRARAWSSGRTSSVTSVTARAARGKKAGALQHRLDRRGQIARLQQHRREIDAEANRVPLPLPQAALPAGGLHDPEREAERKRRRIGDREEIRRRPSEDRARGDASERALPRPPACHPRDRPAADRTARTRRVPRRPRQLRLQRQPRLQLRSDPAIEKNVAAAAGGLGPIQSEVGVAEELLSGCAIVRIERHPDAGRATSSRRAPG